MKNMKIKDECDPIILSTSKSQIKPKQTAGPTKMYFSIKIPKKCMDK